MNREIKKYKTYKAGKNWVVALAIFLGLMGGGYQQAGVKADGVSSSTNISSSSQQSKVSSLSSQRSVALNSSTFYYCF